MRILIATGQWFPDFRGGSARVATETARRLAQRGHEVVVLGPQAEGEPQETTESGLTLRRVLPRNRLPTTFTDIAATVRHGRRAEGTFDVIVGHQSTTAAGLSRARRGSPMVRVFHAPAAREAQFMRTRVPMGRERLMGYALEPALRVLESVSIRSATRVVVLSDFSRQLLLSDFPESEGRIRLARGGVDTDRFTPGDGVDAARARLGLDGAASILFTVRRLEPRMGLDQLFHAMTQLVRVRDLQLFVAGRGILEASLHRLVEELGLTRSVHFLGGIPDEALPDWYRAADLMIVPTVAYEGFGLVTAEALASGTPVVGTPVGATPELLHPLDPRLLAQSAEPPSLATAIDAALGFIDAEFRKRCRDYACAQLSWDVAIAGWEAALSERANSKDAAVAPDRPSTVRG